MKYFKDVSAVREFINCSLLKKDLNYILPITLAIVHYRDGQTMLTEVTNIRRYSENSRPRLYGADNKPIELSYCDLSTLCDEFMRLNDYLKAKADEQKRKEAIESLTLYLGRNFHQEFQDKGLTQAFDGENLDLTNVDVESLPLEQLTKLSSEARSAAMTLITYSKYENITLEDYQNLPLGEKAMWHRAKQLRDDANKEIEWNLYTMFSNASKLNITYPVYSDLWVHKNVEEFFDALKFYKVTEFYMRDSSTACLDFLYDAIENGYYVDSTILLEEDRMFGRISQEKALVLKLK